MSGIQRKGRFEPDKVGLMLSSIFLDQLDTHRDLEHLKPWVQGTGPGVYIKPLKVACVTNRNGQQKRSFETWRDCEKFCTPYETTIPMSCIAAHWCATIYCLEETFPYRRYHLPQTVHARGKPAKSVLERTIYFEQRATEFVLSDSKRVNSMKMGSQ